MIVNHTLVADAGVPPRCWLLVLHGFFGAGRNWATVARRLTAARRDWGVVLADLRLHGASQRFAPPHTLESCADDLIALTDALDVPVRAVLGHSFGGKVALTYLAGRQAAGNHEIKARHPAGLRQVWLVDADPSASAPQGSAWDMLRTVKGLPDLFRAREDLVANLERAGFDRRTAEWLTTNLTPAEGGYRWRLDFAALEALLGDFFQTDLWDVIEQLPQGVDLHVVKATQSNVIADISVSRLEAIGRATGCVVVDHVPGGHWLNADNPEALAALLTARLPAE